MGEKMGKLYSEEEAKKILKEEITTSNVIDQKMNQAYQEIRSKKTGRGKRRAYKKVVVAAAAAALIATTSLVALAANGFFQKEVVESNDSVSYKFTVDYELSANKIDVKPGYLPEGYTTEFAENKFCKEDSWGNGISIIPMTTVDIDRINNEFSVDKIENVEKTTLNGMEAHVITVKEAEKYRRGNCVLLFNPEDGYVIEVWGFYDVPVDELKKVADQLIIEKSQDETVALPTAEELEKEKEMQLEDQKRVEQYQKAKEAGVGEDRIVPIGQEIKAQDFDDDELAAEGGGFNKFGYTIESAQYVDTISEYPKENFYNYDEEIASCLNEDGSLRDHLRQKMSEDGKLNVDESTEESVGSKFLVVDVQVKNYAEKAVDAPLYLNIARLQQRADGTYDQDSKWEYMPVPMENWPILEMPVYFDKPQNVEGNDRIHQFFFRTIQPGETLSYTLMYVIDDDMTGEIFLAPPITSADAELTTQYFSLKTN